MIFSYQSTAFIAPPLTVLAAFSANATERYLEPIRFARAACSLFLSGSSITTPDFVKVANHLKSSQQFDGGWSDPEETAWAARFLKAVKRETSESYKAATTWLNSTRNQVGGWGRHPRDQSRIPITGLIATLLPEVITPIDLDWLETEWGKDFSSPVRLSYKGGFFLLAMAGRPDSDLIKETIKHLACDQNDDGGFAPWREHPIGSDPWSTGVVLWGLSKWPHLVKREVFERALDWLASSQLPSGYWPYHYLDDGTSLALIGATSALRVLSKCAP